MHPIKPKPLTAKKIAQPINQNAGKMSSLSDRMKSHENIYRQYLPKKQYYIVRCDMRVGGRYTNSLNKPFDDNFIESMNYAARILTHEIQGADFAFIQSDEISVVFSDLQSLESEAWAWFRGNMQKICSVSASIVSNCFNKSILINEYNHCPEESAILAFKEFAQFDARVFSISQRHEVLNYFLHRQQDCTRNSIQMLARSVASHKECNNKNTDELQELIFQKSGKNWNDLATHIKRGSAIYKDELDKEIPIFSKNWEWFDDKIIKQENV